MLIKLAYKVGRLLYYRSFSTFISGTQSLFSIPTVTGILKHMRHPGVDWYEPIFEYRFLST